MPKVIDSEGNIVAEFGYTEADKEAAAAKAREIGGTVEESAPDREAMVDTAVEALPTEELMPEEPAMADPAMADPAMADPAMADPAMADPAMVNPSMSPEPIGADQAFVMDVFKAVFSPEFDPNDSQHKMWLGLIEEALGANPEMAEGLKTGDVPMTEFAMQLYRGLPPTGAPPELPPTDSPITTGAGPYFS